MLQHINDLLGLGVTATQLTFTQMFLRTVIIFASMLLMMRLAGRRFIAQRNPLDVLLGVLMGSMLARDINGTTAFWPTLGMGFVLALGYRIVGVLACHFHVIGYWLKGEPHVLVKDGAIQKHMMLRHSISEHDLMEDLRLNGAVDDVKKVEAACIERNGVISVQRIPQIFTTGVEQGVQTVRIQVT